LQTGFLAYSLIHSRRIGFGVITESRIFDPA